MSEIKVIGRKSEYERLDDCMGEAEPQLIGIYGRRRVGKTFLVNSYFEGRFDFKITGVYNQSIEVQLGNFKEELENQTGKEQNTPTNWHEAFSLLKKYLLSLSDKEKQVVFFDEMPWLDTQKSDFMPSFEWFWNGWANSRKNLVFIVCGSAASWMKKNIDENVGGLYNRLTCRIYLKPFNLYETELYLQQKNIEWSRYYITECYMIMGGIPYYLSLLKSSLTYDQNIDNIFFRKRAELWDEFSFLYKTLFSNSEQYIKVVEALSSQKSGLSRNEIITITKLPDNGKLTGILNNLEYSGFIRINDFFGKKKKIYQLSDYYTLFYFKYIKGNYGKDEHFWSNTSGNPSRLSWAGLTFEQVCKDHSPQIKKKIGISAVLSDISVWKTTGDTEHAGAQIDMVINRRDKVINLCEAKYSTAEYEINKKYDMNIRNKIAAFQSDTKTKSALHFTMITTYGVKKNKYSDIVKSEITMDDLFASD